ncbi:MAG TPA: type II secretion system protein [Candidatus Paceibacterota bacterium]|jgi:prepilin-type N-terminal cleavage/methylation domain-containing protein
MRYARTERGFTLIELLVVIAIIGVLSSVVLASLNTARAKARDSKRLGDLTALRTALELYSNDHNNSYPTTAGEWRGTCPDFGAYGKTGTNGWIPNLAPTYLPELPTDPKPIGTSGCYIYNSNGKEYMVGAYQTVEAHTVSSNRWMRPAEPTNATNFTFYSSGAATW